MVADNRPRPGIFGVYIQVCDLDRSLSFYRDVLALELDWSDGVMAVMHSSVEPADALVLRQVGEGARRDLGEPGVTRVLWRTRDSADLDRAEEYLRSLDVSYLRHSEEHVDGISLRDPDGVEFVLLCTDQVPSAEPPSWLYWYR
jgi:catechol 2,3-dioxygenase-like lactoylglutathione lyase family enzyme